MISDHADWAPRARHCLGAGPRLEYQDVLRAGWGIFYDRFDDDQMIIAARFNGTNQLTYIVNNPDFFPTPPRRSRHREHRYLRPDSLSRLRQTFGRRTTWTRPSAWSASSRRSTTVFAHLSQFARSAPVPHERHQRAAARNVSIPADPTSWRSAPWQRGGKHLRSTSRKAFTARRSSIANVHVNARQQAVALRLLRFQQLP